jgi:spore coat polysaccharide biosynthesis protein SpsF
MKTEKYITEQERFWAGEFGTEYILRNEGDAAVASNLNFFSKALTNSRELKSCIEFGANVGVNLKAIKLLYPNIELQAIEINADAVKHLSEAVPSLTIHHKSILEFEPISTSDLTLIKGVLIHINPNELPRVYDKLVASSHSYILIAEYYNPSPVEVSYRGHSDRLFKRDFAGEIIERHPHLKLIDYGFTYRRDPNFPQDDLTWFLLKK